MKGGGADEALELLLAALRAGDQRGVGHALLRFEAVPARLTLVLVKGHAGGRVVMGTRLSMKQVCIEHYDRP